MSQCDYCIIFQCVAMYRLSNILLYTCHLNLWFFIDAQHLAKREIFLFNFHDQGHRFHTWLTFNAFSYIRHRPRKRQWVGTFLFNSIFKTITHGTHQTKWIWTRKHLIDFLLLFVFKSIRFFSRIFSIQEWLDFLPSRVMVYTISESEMYPPVFIWCSFVWPHKAPL